MKHHSIAIFASGNGSNAENLMRYFKQHATISIDLLLCNNPTAGVIEKAKKHQTAVVVVSNSAFEDGETVLNELQKHHIDWIVLAGFLRKIPASLIRQFPNRILNIHPALLPDFGGKGMYGKYVHEAVIAAKATKSGISIHFVNADFDEGEIIAQFETPVQPADTPLSLAEKIHTLEHQHFPMVVEETILNH